MSRHCRLTANFLAALSQSGQMGALAAEHIHCLRIQRDQFHERAEAAEKEVRSLAVHIEQLQRQIAELKSKRAA
jgi:hypothetical protein